MTTLTSLHSGHDVAYFLREREAGGCVGAMSYYTASGEPAGVWAGAGAAGLGLTGVVDPAVIEARLTRRSANGSSPGRTSGNWSPRSPASRSTGHARYRQSCTEGWRGSPESTVQELGGPDP